MARHYPKFYVTDAKHNNRRVMGFAFSCAPCGIYGKLFGSRSSRAKFSKEHQ